MSRLACLAGSAFACARTRVGTASRTDHAPLPPPGCRCSLAHPLQRLLVRHLHVSAPLTCGFLGPPANR